ncbi:phage tail assembly protein [Achromobacter xylosoxidans]|uniref:phage tail assembly protein n=1 Tax=Alcaligenes xylosoxydans xylosoxydans TaxID=85698 RepID=UPI001EEDA4C8|nr:phage tail assembly protein [Achromobacter xylosoxidans]
MPKKEIPDELTITLRKPVTLGQGSDAETFTELALREPIVEEVLAFNKDSAKDAGDALRKLIAKVSGAPIAVINRIGARDFTTAANYLTSFMAGDEDEASEEDEETSAGK